MNRLLSILLYATLGALSGALLGICFRPSLLTGTPMLGAGLDLGLVVWVALVPLMIGIARSKRALSAMFVGYVAAVVWFWLTCRFLLAVNPAAWWICGPIFGLYGATIAALMRRLWRLSPAWTVLTWPLLWVGGDWLWANVGIKFPWFYLAHAVIDADPWYAQTADLFGITGTTFGIVAVNALLLRWIMLPPRDVDLAANRTRWQRQRLATVVTIGGILLAHVYGAVRMHTLPVEENGPVLALMQANMSLGVGRAPGNGPVADRMQEILVAIDAHPTVGTFTEPSTTFAALDQTYAMSRDRIWISRRASAGDAPIDLVVLPETLYPWGYREVLWAEANGRDEYQSVQGTRAMLDVARRNNWRLQLNAMEYDLSKSLDEFSEDGWYASFRVQNCTLLVEPDGTLVRMHAKQELVPVGEYVPFRDTTDLFRDLTVQISGGSAPDLLPGTTSTVFPSPPRMVEAGTPCPYGVAICFETCFPELCRKFTVEGSKLLLVQSNDAWFMREPMDEPGQIWLGARFRAIESRVAVARCVNSGISGVCGPDGMMRDIFEVETGPGRVEQHGIPGALITRVPIGPGASLYVLIGDLFPLVALGISGIIWLASFVVLRRRASREQLEDSASASASQSGEIFTAEGVAGPATAAAFSRPAGTPAPPPTPGTSKLSVPFTEIDDGPDPDDPFEPGTTS